MKNKKKRKIENKKNNNSYKAWEHCQIGIDLVEIERFNDVKGKKQFLKNIYTPKEIRDCEKKKNFIESMAARFAAKEAVKKTIKEKIKFNQIEIINLKNGSPKVKILDLKLKNKYRSIISISHSNKFAEAICLTFKIN